MKIIIDIDKELLEEARVVAVKTGRSIDAVISESVEQMLARQRLIQNRSTIQLQAMDVKELRQKLFDKEKK